MTPKEKAHDIATAFATELFVSGRFKELVTAITQALEEVRQEGFQAGIESERAVIELAKINQEMGLDT